MLLVHIVFFGYMTICLVGQMWMYNDRSEVALERQQLHPASLKLFNITLSST